MPIPKFPFIPHGADYNPEQWPEETWDEDVQLMQKAGVNIATLPVFGWGNLQLDEETWNFDWLDKVIDKLHAGGIRICLATATAAVPPWIDQKYPDVLRVDGDGRKQHHGGRHTFCPHSDNFRRLSTGLARKMAERYGKHPAVLLWHISNEYGQKCYCEKCSAAFREWLKQRYGTLDEVNHRWNMAFWGQTYTDWSQIEAPITIAQRSFQGLLIDYDRFASDSILECCKAEAAVLRELTPNLPITTNMMGAFKPLDYHRWAKELDVISWDSYPPRNAPPFDTAFKHALMRGLKEGQPWMLMEQTPSQQNWQPYNSLKRPGVMRLWSYQAMAHGADSVMYFQWRRSPGAQEMLHGAVVEHAARTDARVFQEVSALGAELVALGDKTLETRVEADVAILFDWDNWWAVEYSSGPSIEAKYPAACVEVYGSLHDLNITTDIVSPFADLSPYRVVIAPMLKMVKPGFSEAISAFVEAGGTFLTTYFSGIVDETDRSFPNGYPGPLAKLLGIWVEEIDALSPGETNAVTYRHEHFDCGSFCDRIRLEGAEALGTYEKEFYAGEPAITRNGRSYYVGTKLTPDGWRKLLSDICREAGALPCFLNAPVAGVEVLRRSADGRSHVYLLNHNADPVGVPLPPGKFTDLLTGRSISGSLRLERYGVAILDDSSRPPKAQNH
jgi:beta-galactosidase